MMKSLLIFVTILSLAVTKSLRETRADYWNQFVVEYNRTFESAGDEELRENIFWESLKTISHHNFKFRRSKKLFKMGINKFADMTFDEYSNMYTPNDSIKDLSKKLAEGISVSPSVIYHGKKKDKAPPTFDWREHGAVTRIKDQGTCGSCYAMATIAALESSYSIASGKLVELSEQEIIDCAGTTYNALGCSGGVAFKVFKYVKDKGISAASQYPYEAKAGKCRATEKEVATLKGYGFVISGDIEVIKKALVKFGPLVVSMDINHESFQRYSGGIYYDPACSSQVNHGALLIGYGKDYWIIKNSFGETWGEKGFARIANNRGNDCDLSSVPLFPILKVKKSRKDLDYLYSKDKNAFILQNTNELN